MCVSFFFFNDTATTEIYTLSLHDALPISVEQALRNVEEVIQLEGPQNIAAFILEPVTGTNGVLVPPDGYLQRSEEHTSELQSRLHLVCRLLLEKKKKARHTDTVFHYTEQT